MKEVTMKPQYGRNFWIKDVGHCLELTSTLFYGIIGGVEYLLERGYELNYNAITTIGGMYVIPTIGKDSTETKENEIHDQLKALKTENRILKTQITKLKKKTKVEDSE